MSNRMKGNGRDLRMSQLSSGLRIVTEKSLGMRTAAIGVWIRAGARDERPAEHGLAHFLEHMAFKGTKRRSAQDIVEEIESVGGDLNAETTVENTAYYARVMGKDYRVVLDILADILIGSTFDDVEMRREKSVILQEIAAAEDDPEELASDRFLETAFPGQALGRPILGAKHTVRAFDRRAIRAYLRRNYVASNMVVAAIGAVEHEEIVAATRRAFADLPRTAGPIRPTAIYRGGELRLARRLEQVQMQIGFPGTHLSAQDFHAYSAFANAVGGGMSSRLFQEVRERRGLAYSIEAYHWPFADCGTFVMTAGTGERQAGDFVRVAIDSLADATETLTEEEVGRAKAQMRVSLMSSLESPSRRLEQIARQTLIYGRVWNARDILARIDAVTLEAARAAGRKILSGAPTLVSVGPVKYVPRLDDITVRIGRPPNSEA